MCGIAVVVGGVRVDLSILSSRQVSSPADAESCVFTVEELKAALRRRGPDSLGTKKVLINLRNPSSTHDENLPCVSVQEEGPDCEKSGLISSVVGENGFGTHSSAAEMQFMGAVLQLRGTNPIQQPLTDPSVNVLVYNGEIYGGIEMNGDNNDTEVLMDSLGDCCRCSSHDGDTICSRKNIPELLSVIKGPWALIYWQDSTRTLWFGRDAFGRRSLLVHWPTLEDPRLLLSSVSPPSSADSEVESGSSSINYWEELPCGVYSLTIDASSANGCISGKVTKHEWTTPLLNELIRWERKLVEPKFGDFHSSSSLISTGEDNMLPGTLQSSVLVPAHMVLDTLRKSVARRTVENAIFQTKRDQKQEQSVPVAVLFSGGVDSMILAVLLHECLDARYVIDLLNVSFEGDSAPDRITGRAGLKELKIIAPNRSWRLVEIDADLSNLSMEMKHVKSLITPAKTYMDLNIGLALWLAAGGDGLVYENGNSSSGCAKYKSEARILLVGSGADEQCAGYGRHRTKYRSSSWIGLNEEMKLDVQRIWKRNLGRDDRCIADSGREARFPFLDEDVIRILLSFPLWDIANLDQPSGTGDKKILREVAKLLGLHEAAALPKRAIQFGSRIAQESNKKNFGSNRAANHANAGSVVIYR